MDSPRDPKLDPQKGDVFRKWDQDFTVTRCTQGLVFTNPPLYAWAAWIGISAFRTWAKDTQAIAAAPKEPAE